MKEKKKKREGSLDHLISDSYRKLNTDLHTNRAVYGSHGSKHFKKVFGLAKEYEASTILDYGCGKGYLKLSFYVARDILDDMPLYDVREYDPAIKKKSRLPEPAEILVCTDVLEHVEPHLIENVLKHHRELTQKVAYLLIATRPSKKILGDGRNAHVFVKPEEWWRKKLSEHWNIEEWVVNGKNEIACVLTPKISGE
jgi:hypothetical protein